MANMCVEILSHLKSKETILFLYTLKRVFTISSKYHRRPIPLAPPAKSNQKFHMSSQHLRILQMHPWFKLGNLWCSSLGMLHSGLIYSTAWNEELIYYAIFYQQNKTWVCNDPKVLVSNTATLPCSLAMYQCTSHQLPLSSQNDMNQILDYKGNLQWTHSTLLVEWVSNIF